MRHFAILSLIIVFGCERNQPGAASGDHAYTMDDEEVLYALPPKELPENFPLSLMNRATVEHSATTESEDASRMFQVSLSADAQPERVADFYTEEFKGQGLAVQREEVRVDRAQQVMLLGESETAEATALVARNANDPRTTITITWTDKAAAGAAKE
jgi:hypothetical protein